jgi:putative membrane-bound dehydrogenase-like protein
MPDSRTYSGWAAVAALFIVAAGCASLRLIDDGAPAVRPGAPRLTIRQDPAGTIEVRRSGSAAPVLTQVARADERPYLHPILAPDGTGVLTEDSPAHHPHQSGLYWGFTRLNGRDYFHNRKGDYWRRVSATVLESGDGDDAVRWQTVYDLLDASGAAVLTETLRWTMKETNRTFVLDLEWKGEARTDVTIGRYDYGGLFLRMPWRQGIAGEVVNAARQRNERAEGQRAMWIDVGMTVEGRSDAAHVAIFDHPGNPGYPQAWRVDSQLGVGSARARAGDTSIKKGGAEVIRHQFVIYTGALDDLVLTQAWAAFSGNRSPYATQALWGIAQREGREAQFLTPDQAVAQMTVADGYRVAAWAAEPMIAQPMAFCWDDRGRLWVAENRDYESRVRGFSNAGTSRILILEDTDRDGVADSRKVFMEGLAFPAALAVGFGGVFVGAPPNLLFVPDRNGDDKADVENIEVRLTGWGIQDRHETINSLHWGPDGWLYGLQGYATSSKIRKPAAGGRLYRHKDPFPNDVPGGDGVAGIEINGGVWRYHPTRDVFEVVAHGFSNPWGIDYDAKGQLLISACVIPHLWHVIPGGIYHRQGGQHFNPYVYDDIKTIADHRHRSAHGGARVYQSDAFPPSQQGRIFMANIHEHAVLSDVLERKGSGFTARHGDDFMMANNAQWIGFSVEIGPDGALYVLDWHDGDICGQDVLHQETGRIYRIAPTRSLAENFEGRYANLAAMADGELVRLQTSRSDWHARRARVILQHRAAAGRLQPGTHDALRALFTTAASADQRLRAMWALHVTGGWTADALLDALADRDEHVRAWAIQFLAEDRSVPPRALDAFARLAREDGSAVVRLYLTSALQRIEPSRRWPIAAALMQRGEDAGDHNLPKMLWLGVEPLVAGDPRTALEHAGRSAVPLVARFTARRVVDMGSEATLESLVAAIAAAPPAQAGLLEGLRDGLEGRFDVTAPASWRALHGRLQRGDARLAALARDIAQQFGDTETARRNLATIKNGRAPLDDRRRALQTLAGQRRPELVDELAAVIDDRALRVDGIRAAAAFDDNALGRLLVDRYPTFNAAERYEAIQTLASRPRYGRMLVEAIVKDIVPRTDIPASIPRQLLRVVGTKFLEVWGPIERSAVEEQAYAKYRTLLGDEALRAANVPNGHDVFLRSCGACHKLHGEGGTIGPDLTGANRSSLDYLLLNVLSPNAEVADAYKMSVVTTRDGRTYSGTVASENDRQLTLRVPGRDAVAIAKADIQSREATSASMMPPGLFDALSDREVIDLVAYLRTLEKIR